jgi:prepilin peptidase CpaA
MSFLLVRAILWTAALSVLALGAATDLRDRIIPNEAVILIAVLGLALCFVSRPGSMELNLLTSVILLCSLWPLVQYDILGGGDAKLIAAVTLLVPPDRIGVLLIEIALAGGVLSAIYLAAHRALQRMRVAQPDSSRLADVWPPYGFARFLHTERIRITTENSVPYALAVLGGVGFHVANELYQCLSATSCSL